jgi:hypothetical protein
MKRMPRPTYLDTPFSVHGNKRSRTSISKKKKKSRLTIIIIMKLNSTLLAVSLLATIKHVTACANEWGRKENSSMFRI